MMQNNAFLGVSSRIADSVLRIADRTNIKHHSKTIKFDLGWLARSPCCAAAYDMHTEMSSSPTGGLRLPAGKHTIILTD